MHVKLLDIGSVSINRFDPFVTKFFVTGPSRTKIVRDAISKNRH